MARRRGDMSHVDRQSSLDARRLNARRFAGLTLAMAMFIAAFVFLAPNVTGNAIAGMDVPVSNVFGILLFFAAIIIVYISMSRMLRMDFNYA